MAKLQSGTIIYGTADIQSTLSVGTQSSNNSTSNTTGSLVVSGGVGVSGNVYASKVFSNSVDLLNYTQSAFDKANTLTASVSTNVQGIQDSQNTSISNVNSYAQSVYNQANAATTLAQNSFNAANTNAASITYIQGVNVGQNNYSIGVNNFAQGAYDKANSGTTLAQAAFDSANNASSGAVAAAYDLANASVLLAQASFNQANTNASDITVIQGVNLGQNTSITAVDTFAQSAFAKANSASSNTIYTQGVNDGQNTTISAINTYTQSAYNLANNAVLLAGGTITGSLTVNQDVSVLGNLNVLGTSTTINTEQLELDDTLIYLGLGNYTSDLVDIGFIGHYNPGSTNAHTGFIRSAATKEFYLFDGYEPEIRSNNNIDLQDASFSKAPLNADVFKGNVIASTVVVNGLEVGAHTVAAYNQANTGTLIAQSSFDKANTNASNITTIQGVNVTQNTAITAITNYSNSAYALANTNASDITIIEGVEATQNTNITTATNLAQAAFNYANTLPIFGGVASYSGVTINTNAFITSSNLTTSSTAEIAIDSFDATLYRSAKYEVQLSSNSNFHVMEIRVVHDDTDIWLTEYADMQTDMVLGTFSASINPTGTFNLLLTPTYSVTDVKVMRSNLLI
jgi:hypothetical protein